MEVTRKVQEIFSVALLRSGLQSTLILCTTSYMLTVVKEIIEQYFNTEHHKLIKIDEIFPQISQKPKRLCSSITR
jgi:hypothetical protein